MMSGEEVKAGIRTGFRELVESEPQSLSELDRWNARAASLKLLMAEDIGDIRIPHLLWHYLDDAGVRLKDQRYAVEQLAEIKTVMQEW